MPHTPGPWLASDDDPAIDCIKAGDECVICFGHDYNDYGRIATNDDARLITAAPDLLAACVIALDLLEEYVQGAEEAHAQVRAAIAKAEGR